MSDLNDAQVLDIGGDTRQFLSFKLGKEEYGVDILKVQEIKGWEGATPIPNMPAYILGVINLRGTVVPIINLRSLFEMDELEFTKPQWSSWCVSPMTRKVSSARSAWLWTQYPRCTTSLRKSYAPPPSLAARAARISSWHSLPRQSE
jgi:hypothetical protein